MTFACGTDTTGLDGQARQHGHALARLVDVCAVVFPLGRILRPLGASALSFYEGV